MSLPGLTPEPMSSVKGPRRRTYPWQMLTPSLIDILPSVHARACRVSKPVHSEPNRVGGCPATLFPTMPTSVASTSRSRPSDSFSDTTSISSLHSYEHFMGTRRNPLLISAVYD
ncbi:vegetative cell wall protein gp1-like [Iris pallida]|uniref:Vegetative cell wall protein gp1-like n=1 Tax=Iris pallida TaxID=29817 RepID=A0AAX6DX53_IRIPA|nr:vegetative cell wall protein gp1-like [Iris pallida]